MSVHIGIRASVQLGLKDVLPSLDLRRKLKDTFATRNGYERLSTPTSPSNSEKTFLPETPDTTSPRLEKASIAEQASLLSRSTANSGTQASNDPLPGKLRKFRSPTERTVSLLELSRRIDQLPPSQQRKLVDDAIKGFFKQKSYRREHVDSFRETLLNCQGHISAGQYSKLTAHVKDHSLAADALGDIISYLRPGRERGAGTKLREAARDFARWLKPKTPLQPAGGRQSEVRQRALTPYVEEVAGKRPNETILKLRKFRDPADKAAYLRNVSRSLDTLKESSRPKLVNETIANFGKMKQIDVDDVEVLSDTLLACRKHVSEGHLLKLAAMLHRHREIEPLIFKLRNPSYKEPGSNRDIDPRQAVSQPIRFDHGNAGGAPLSMPRAPQNEQRRLMAKAAREPGFPRDF